MTIFFDTNPRQSVPLEFTPDQSMYRPGELMSAMINGKEAVVYLTMDEVAINEEGEPQPRFRTYPEHSIVDMAADMKIDGPLKRFVPIPSGLLKN